MRIGLREIREAIKQGSEGKARWLSRLRGLMRSLIDDLSLVPGAKVKMGGEHDPQDYPLTSTRTLGVCSPWPSYACTHTF